MFFLSAALRAAPVCAANDTGTRCCRREECWGTARVARRRVSTVESNVTRCRSLLRRVDTNQNSNCYAVVRPYCGPKMTRWHRLKTRGGSAGEGGTTGPRLAEGRTNTLKTKGGRTAAIRALAPAQGAARGAGESGVKLRTKEGRAARRDL
jgi:hypothetical protein